MQRLATVLLVVATAVVSATCRGAETTGPPPAVPATVALVSGTSQTGIVGHPLPQPLIVEVTAADGRAVAGVAVLWAIRSGAGSLSATTVATDAQGLAAVTFTLGSLAGSQRDTVAATVTGLASVSFVISATADVAAQLVMVSGDGQLGVVGQALSQPLVIETRDQFGNQTSGSNVTWSVIAGGGNVSASTTLTDALGRAGVTWTLGTAAGVLVDSVSASATGLAGSPARFAASAQSGPVTSLVMVSGDGQTAFVAQAVSESLVVEARDQFGNGVSGAMVQWAAAAGSGSVSQASVPTDAAGRSRVRWTLGIMAGAQQARASVAGAVGSPVSFDANATPGPATALTFIAEPFQTPAGIAIAPPVEVGVVDAFGNAVTSSSATIDIALATNPGGATLGGTTQVSASGGTAVFSNLQLDKVGTGYVLQATSAGLTPATSAPFTVVVDGNTLHLAFTVQPVTTDAGATITATVAVIDGFGNTNTGFTGDIAVSIASNPAGGTLSGTLTVAATAGVAVFADLSIDKTGTGYSLSAMSPALPAALSASFEIHPGPATTLVFTTQPATTGATAIISPPVQLTALDAFGNQASGFSNPVTVSIVANPAGGTLSGTTTVTASQGMVTFPDLRIDQAGAGYTLQATAAGLTPVTSASFDITAAPSTLLAFVTQPSNATAGATIVPALQVAARDSFGNTVTTFTGTVTIAIGTNPGGGTLSGTLARAATGGVATFDDLSIDKAGVAYVLTATAAPLAGASSAPFTITAGAVSASQSTVAASPTSISASSGGTKSTITVTARDAFGNRVTGAAVVLAATGSGNTLTQPTGSTDVNGSANGSLSATLAESKTVSATVGGVSVTQQATVTVTAAAASVLAFTTQPTNTAATVAINGGSGGVVVTARDPFGNTSAAFTSSVSMAIGTNPGGGTLSGTLTRSAVAGVATFTNLSINASGTGYTLVATSGSLTQASSTTFNITGGTVVVSAGNSQSGLKGFALNVAPAVLVRDATNAPIANAPVTFQVVTGGGSVTGADAVTDANGIARVGSWTVQLGANSMTATVAVAGLTGNPVTFTATGVNATYHVDVRFLSSMSPSRQAAFSNAASRWESLIYGDVSTISVNIPAGSCGSNSPRIQETIDDIVIYATVDSIDGPGNVLGAAGPCFIRSSSKLPLLGAMIFDSADVAQLEADGQFELVILHEMGHVLGYGTIWTDLNLLQNAGGANAHFSGATAIQAFDRSGGQGFSGGSKVPVENCVGFPPEICGGGTQDSHWRELVFGNELMTGYLDPGGNPLSVVTTASMGDLGYTVNYAASDVYLVVNPVPAEGARRGPARQLKNDILHFPVIEVDESGP